MKKKDFKDKRITVMGLGLHGGGVEAVKFFSQAKAKVLVTDLRTPSELKPSLDKLKKYQVEFILGQHRPEDFSQADLIIKNPAIRKNSKYLQIARDNKVPIKTATGIFFKLCPAPIIGITGSKGKSTTATLITEVLKKKYSSVFLAGNIGQSALKFLPKIKEKSLVVLELSSWQLAGLKKHKKSPHVAIVTNILHDHMNYYKSLTDYVADKNLIWQFQKKEDHLILNYDNEHTREMAHQALSQVHFFSQNSSEKEAYIKDKKVFFKDEEIIPCSEIKLKGHHNLDNILAAVSLSKLYKVSNSDIASALKEFSGVKWRMEFITEIEGVQYINDTAATIPEACQAALDSFSNKKVILIAGGADKNLDFSELALKIKEKAKTVILLKGSATNKLKQAISEAGGQVLKEADNMAEAVQIASQQAEPGEIVLLSPACASFGMFKHEFDRGQAFNDAVVAIKE